MDFIKNKCGVCGDVMPEYRISVGWDVPIEIGPILFADKALRKSSFSYLLLAFSRANGRGDRLYDAAATNSERSTGT